MCAYRGPLLATRHVHLDLCTPEVRTLPRFHYVSAFATGVGCSHVVCLCGVVRRQGELERRSVTKGKHLREVYRASRKAQWGALWPADASIYTEKKQS